MRRALLTMARCEPFNLTVEPKGDRGGLPITLTFRPAANDHLQGTAVVGGLSGSAAPRCLRAVTPAGSRAHREPTEGFPCLEFHAAGIPNFVGTRPSVDSSVDTTRLSITSTTSGSGVDASRFWFAVLQQIELDPSLLPDTYLGSNGAASGSAGALAPAPLHAYGQTKPAAFADIELLQLLGAGSFGRVYRAKWQGSMVAIKVRGRP